MTNNPIIHVTDKGFVQLISATFTSDSFRDLNANFFKDPKYGLHNQLLDIPSISILLKSPIFVQLTFGNQGLSTVIKNRHTQPEVFEPCITDIKAESLEANQAILKDIKNTSAALLINPTAYQYEKCDPFISQINTPIAVYNEYMVSGTLRQWVRYITNVNYPSPIDDYRSAILEIIKAEYTEIVPLINGLIEYGKEKKKENKT